MKRRSFLRLAVAAAITPLLPKLPEFPTPQVVSKVVEVDLVAKSVTFDTVLIAHPTQLYNYRALGYSLKRLTMEKIDAPISCGVSRKRHKRRKRQRR